MAWQSGPVSGSGAGAGGLGAGDQSGVQAYTLQGVMRFLQSEWHRHERDRNAWEIEREEMKKRIAALEGDSRTSRGLRLSLEKNVKLLEMALKKERDKVKNLAKGGGGLVSADLGRDSKEVAREQLAAAGSDLPYRGFTHLDAELDAQAQSQAQLAQGVRQEQERDKSKSFLTKCSGEITYHTLPTSHIPPAAADTLPPNNLFTGRQPSQQELQDAYMELQRLKQEQYRSERERDRALLRDSHLRDGQLRDGQLRSSSNQAAVSSLAGDLARVSPQQPLNLGLPLRDAELKPTSSIHGTNKAALGASGPPYEEHVEAVSHSYDSYGRQVPPPVESLHAHVDETKLDDSSSGWDFDPGPSATTLAPATTTTSAAGALSAPSAAAAAAVAVAAAAATTTTTTTATEPSGEAAPLAPPLRPDMEAFPAAGALLPKSPPRAPGSRRKSSGARRRSEGSIRDEAMAKATANAADLSQFKIRFAMRGHLDVVRAVIFTGGGSPSEPEFCTASDDGGVKRWHIPASYTHLSASADDLDRIAHFTHRGHVGAVCSLAACPASSAFSNGGRVPGDGWIFSGGEDATVRVWERGRVDAKAILDGHTDAVWALCVLPGTTGSILGDRCSHFGGPDRLLLAAGGADGTILVWAVSQPPQLSSPLGGANNRGARGSRRANSVSAGSNFPSSPQPSVASNHPFHYSLVHRIERQSSKASPTSISPLSPSGESMVVSYSDASVVVFDLRTGEEIVGMASLETYDGTPNTGVNVVVAANTTGFDTASSLTHGRRGSIGEDDLVHGATGTDDALGGLVIAGYEDRFIRFFDANSGQCTYTMLAHPAAISALSLSPDGRELVSGGHDASLRFWSLEKRSCTQEITSHRIMRGEGVCGVVWSPDGRWVISCGGDGIVKCFSRS